MKSADKSKRRFWQIHLSTAILLMLVAGAFLWRCSLPVYADNLQPDILANGEMRPLIGELGFQVGYLQYGWPQWGYRTQGGFQSEVTLQELEKYLEGTLDQARSDPRYVSGKGITYSPTDNGAWHEFNTIGIIIDGVVALIILAVVAATCEFFIRRRVQAAPTRET